MRLTIIRDMGLVHINGRGYDELDMTGIPEEIHALQWYDDNGEIEYVGARSNEVISAIPDWAGNKIVEVQAMLAADDKKEADRIAYENSPEGKAEQARIMRNELMAETDWWASSDLNMSQEQIDYRQALRDITSQPEFPNSIIWPVKPK